MTMTGLDIAALAELGAVSMHAGSRQGGES